MKSRHLLSMVTVITVIISSSFSQEIPQLIYYQGSLADAGSKPVNGSHNITFSIWNSLSGGSKIWEETHNSVPVSSGLFSIVLGSKNAITIDDFSSKQRYLQITISGETLSPRQRIASVPYSHTAGSISGSTNVVPSNGNAGIGTIEPQSKLHIKMEGENKLQLPLRLVNPDGTDAGGTATGILFETESSGFGKGALVYERKSDWGNGSFHFLQNTLNNSSNPNLNDAVVTIKNDGDMITAGTVHSKEGGFKFPDGSVQVSAAGSGGTADNLGNHTATQNLNLNGHWLSGDGGSEGVFVQNNGKVGIGNNNTSANLQVDGTDGVLFTGTFDSGSIPAEGAGTRMMWYPGKAAFRAGYAYNNKWDDSNIGLISTAMGYNTTAFGNASTAIGEFTEAIGDISTAMGGWTKAIGDNSTAIGKESEAHGVGSTAMGYSTRAIGDFSTAMGYASRASGEYSTSMGWYTVAKSYASLAIGKYNYAGPYNTPDSWVPTEWIFTIGDGSWDQRSNLLYVAKNGNMWIKGSLSEGSDRRLKEDIEPLNNTLENLKQLNGVSFRWKDNENMGTDKHLGLIAQDVEKVYPELVGENEGYKTLNYNGIIPVLVEAVKELHEMNERQQKKIEALENRLNK